jgi:nicotinate-nucleotide adenylyltransferase
MEESPSHDILDAMKTGLLGGSFDPIHIGHLLMARMALEGLGLRRVIFVPSARPPHKTVATPARHRLAMVRAAVRGLPEFEVSDIELRRTGPSYTVHTVEALRPDVVIVGADTLSEIDGWYESARLRRMVRIVSYPRGGKRGSIRGPALEISSREIRSRLRRGLPITHWVPRAVEKYIYSRGLYR